MVCAKKFLGCYNLNFALNTFTIVKYNDMDEEKYTKSIAYVVPGIWMGDRRAARDMDILGNLDIGTIINVSGFDNELIEDVDIYNYTIYDNNLMENELERALNKINTICNILKRARDAKKNVLVNDSKDCVNRAPFVVAYYLVRDLGWEPAAAINAVKDANESRDMAPRETVSHRDDDNVIHNETRCKYVRTLTNQSFRKIICQAKK